MMRSESLAERHVCPSDLAQRYRTTRRSVPHRYRRENMSILYSVDTARPQIAKIAPGELTCPALARLHAIRMFSI